MLKSNDDQTLHWEEIMDIEEEWSTGARERKIHA